MNQGDMSGRTPKAAMGPALGTIFALAGLISVATLGVVLLNLYQDGGSALAELYMRALAGTELADRALRASLIPLTLMALWAFCMVGCTLARSAAGPALTTTAFALWLIGWLVAPKTIAPGAGSLLTDLAAYGPQVVMTLIIIAAYAGFMFDGERPRLIYGSRRS